MKPDAGYGDRRKSPLKALDVDKGGIKYGVRACSRASV